MKFPLPKTKRRLKLEKNSRDITHKPAPNSNIGLSEAFILKCRSILTVDGWFSRPAADSTFCKNEENFANSCVFLN